ncbi:Zinc finger RING-CH-type [Penicillium bovifimosum]|uniref:Zinc finger RING-CH-type n=1 Tax=Penicillium bovifimosum TaxID=126998 RepID=A0A9W9H083_9EURO|nr:Zinc finger RING-CH-type [Penicillium bovifimosum]KAJ5135145.1 Zinc finger RING-CH-type [Penicillium bovifimosum]
MASIPGYSAVGRARSSEGAISTNSGGNSLMQEDSLSDTETVFFGDDIPARPTRRPEWTPSSTSLRQPSEPAHVPEEEEPRKCWICYTDETEDSPLNLEWRSPCPCALTAHEACLLDWLADMENPRTRKSGGRAVMQCPQCKSEIVVSRPRSYVVDMLRLMERVAGRLVLPGMMFTVAGTLWAGCFAHGVWSVYMVFGFEDAVHMIEDAPGEDLWAPELSIGVPLIPIVLIFLRTRYAEGILPAIPVLFFASRNLAQDLDFTLWPPTPVMTFVALPYISSFYGALYDRLFGGFERKWIAEVQPRAAEEILDDAQQQDQAEGLNGFDDEDGNILMEIDLQLQMGVGDGDEPDLALPAEQGQDVNGGGPGGQAQNADQNNPMGIGARHQIINGTSNLADLVLGALFFPAVSASVGGLLTYVLPKKWTSPPSIMERGRLGLLQTRWGRSVVGGCMFVLLKDALVLYCRWKLAQTHRRRKVLNYDRSKKKPLGAKRSE